MRKCIKCDVKLPSRSPSSFKKYKNRELCQHCYNNPSDEERCIAITSTKKERCKHRSVPESKLGYCGAHKRIKEDKA